jgi:outer membrane protein OmpA-like peptidoglycan-associated protein
VTRQRWKTGLLIVAGIVLLLAAFNVFVLPAIVKSQVVQRVEAATGRTLEIGGISFNPLTLTVVIDDFRFTERGSGETFAAFSNARITMSPLSLYRRTLIVASAHITSPHFRIVRIGTNSYNFSDLRKWLPLHPRLSVNNLTMTNGSVDFIDQGLPAPQRQELRKIELAVPFITTMAYYSDRFVAPRLSAELNGKPLQLEGTLRPFPRAAEASLTITVQDLPLPNYLAYLPTTLPLQIESGRLSGQVVVTYRTAEKEKPELTLAGRMTFAEMKVSDRSGAPFLAVTRVDADINYARFLAREFALSSLIVEGLEVFLTRDAKGVWSHSRLTGEPSPGAPPRRKSLVTVTKAQLRNGRVHFVDNVPPGGLTTDLEGVVLDLHNYATSPGNQASYDLSFATLREEKGRLQGEFSLRPLAATATFELDEVELAAYSPYFAALLPARVKGRCDLSGNLAFGGPEGTRLEKVSIQARQLVVPVGKGKGLTLEALSLNGGRFSSQEQRLEATAVTLRDGDLQFSRDREGAILPLTWERLQLDQLKWSLAPFALDIAGVTLSRFSSEIVVAPGGSHNLQQFSPAEKGEKVATGGKGRIIRINTVTLEDGSLVFSDQHVPGGFSTTLDNLGGRISGLSSESHRFADVDLHGSLEKRSPLTITGQINPLRVDLFVDLKGSFDAIELAPLTPYAVTYLGYAIDQGQLFVNSNYRIKERKLDVENNLRIAQLDFGQRMESEKAISTAVQLAVALLKDRQGEIYLDLPVTGRTDDPHFSVSNLVLELLRNLLKTAEAAPLSLLPSLSGAPEDWNSVGFAPGSTELSLGEQEKLRKLATALNDRPALKIRVVGFADRVGDDAGLRSLAEDRAAGVRAFLVEQGKMDGARLLLESGESDRTPGSRVVFEVVVDN